MWWRSAFAFAFVQSQHRTEPACEKVEMLAHLLSSGCLLKKTLSPALPVRSQHKRRSRHGCEARAASVAKHRLLPQLPSFPPFVCSALPSTRRKSAPIEQWCRLTVSVMPCQWEDLWREVQFTCYISGTTVNLAWKGDCLLVGSLSLLCLLLQNLLELTPGLWWQLSFGGRHSALCFHQFLITNWKDK